MRRRVVRAPIDVRVGRTDHVDGLILDVVDEPRRRRRAAVGDPVPIVAGLVVSASVSVVLSREVGGMDLRLFVIVLVARPLDDVRAVVGGAAEAARRQRRAADELLHGGGRGLQQGLLQALVGGRVRDVRAVRRVRRRVRRRRGRRAHRLQQRL